jgi:hypothetical protein
MPVTQSPKFNRDGWRPARAGAGPTAHLDRTVTLSPAIERFSAR